MHSMSFRRTLAAPSDVAWTVISDVGNYNRVAPNIDRSRIVSGTGKGMVRECSNKDGAWMEVCTDWHHNESFSFEVQTDARDYPYPFNKLFATWSVRPVSEEECEVRMDFRFQFRSEEEERDIYPVMKKQFSEVCEQLLDNWQKEIERSVRVQ
jgi:ribosome-associated toxin RatA of RatAB toxin-antitoxin module